MKPKTVSDGSVEKKCPQFIEIKIPGYHPINSDIVEEIRKRFPIGTVLQLDTNPGRTRYKVSGYQYDLYVNAHTHTVIRVVLQQLKAIKK